MTEVPALTVAERTALQLARDRDGDAMAEPRRLLCLLRGDHRPCTAAAGQNAILAIAADEGCTAEQVRTDLDQALRAEGTSLQAWLDELDCPLVRLGGHRTPRIGVCTHREAPLGIAGSAT